MIYTVIWVNIYNILQSLSLFVFSNSNSIKICVANTIVVHAVAVVFHVGRSATLNSWFHLAVRHTPCREDQWTKMAWRPSHSGWQPHSQSPSGVGPPRPPSCPPDQRQLILKLSCFYETRCCCYNNLVKMCFVTEYFTKFARGLPILKDFLRTKVPGS